MSYTFKIKSELQQNADPEKADFLPRFFRAVPGGYGEGDLFIGVKVPLQRKIARKFYREISLQEVETLLQDAFHECRLTALFIAQHGCCLTGESPSTMELVISMSYMV